MKITKIDMRKLVMRMKSPFTTSFGTVQDKEFFLFTVHDELGHEGWGESVAFSAPWYTEETIKTTEHINQDFLIPLLLGKTISHPDEVYELFQPIRKNPMAKAGIEGAVWDAYAKRTKQSLAQALGGQAQQIEVGISVGLQKDIPTLIRVVNAYIQEGYKRVKVKIKPSEDRHLLKALREHFPNLPLMADANSAYSLEDIALLKSFDEFNLLMIEQPLAPDDLVDHATLQKEMKTPICLDESIVSLKSAKDAIALGSCRVINLKIGRVGGLSEAKRIHDYCAEREIPVWCGGMLEAGIGRAHNIAMTSLQNFVMPGDTASSSRYWEEDIIVPEVVAKKGFIEVPTSVGIGFEPNEEVIDRYTVERWSYQL